MSSWNHTTVRSRSLPSWEASAKKTAGLVLFALTFGLPTGAMAVQANCGPLTEILKELAKRFSEAPVAVGLANNGALVEVLTSGGGSTWTIIVSEPSGTSCLVAAGESWQDLKHVAGGLGV